MDIAQYGLLGNDLEFLRKKELNGELIIVTGSSTGTGELVAYTPATGKTFFLIRASIIPQSATATEVYTDVENNGTDVDYLYYTRVTGGSGPSRTDSVVIGDSLVGDGAKKYRINIISNSGSQTVKGVIFGWIEDS